MASTAEAAVVAAKSGDPKLIADARLADAEAALAGGDARKALDGALAAHQWFDREGVEESEWRCLLAASRAERALGETAKSHEHAARASDRLAGLAQKWDSDSYKQYLARPDIQYNRGWLSRLAVAK